MKVESQIWPESRVSANEVLWSGAGCYVYIHIYIYIYIYIYTHIVYCYIVDPGCYLENKDNQ